ncbi:helix-turn-helix transcriptional regulator [Lysobacter enzymogenes]|uniref:helix-turn-helix transcriptional regulator n=1 Tax=Lysobacter enzymogenes TaxID=69 RepID=UPI000894D3C4|nr:helix-turn-helix domain-containing protein [Lysobacter enzymogenes]SDW84826.1 hypothetical protein SAMN05421681_1038 [Lysobacter enzymogenes]
MSSDDLDRIRARLALLPSDTAFTSAEAAIYTGRSTRTLKRAIDAGVGPKREKNPDVSGRGATNRHTRYRKADLDAWRESLVSFATDFRSFDDLTADAPWMLVGEQLTGHLLDLESVEAILEAMAANTVIFLRLEEALQQSWASDDLRRPYQNAFEAVCREAVRAAADAAQRDALEAETGPALGEGRGPLRP